MAAAAEASASSGSSDTSSTGEEERIRRLFQTCDGDGDGYINRNDLLMVCRQLNMEDSVAEIMCQLGADQLGRISFEDFTRCRMQLVSEIRKEEGLLSLLSSDSDKRRLRERIASWPTSSENSLGALSGAKESWEYDSGARDLQSPDLPSPPQQPRQQSSVLLQKFLEQPSSVSESPSGLHKFLSQPSGRSAPVGGGYVDLANTFIRVQSCLRAAGFYLQLMSVEERWLKALAFEPSPMCLPQQDQPIPSAPPHPSPA